MAYTDIQICNLALTHLGDVARVANITVPTSAQEVYCAQYYAIARDQLQEQHPWSFNTVRKALVAAVGVTAPASWQYVYDLPAGMVNLLAVVDPDASDDYTVAPLFTMVGPYSAPQPNVGVPIPYPFVVEYDETNSKRVILTNLKDAVARYTIVVTDPTKWSHQFVMALSYRLASMLAGPIIKGDAGAKMGESMERMSSTWARKAEGTDSNNRNVQVASGAPWIVGR